MTCTEKQVSCVVKWAQHGHDGHDGHNVQQITHGHSNACSDVRILCLIVTDTEAVDEET